MSKDYNERELQVELLDRVSLLRDLLHSHVAEHALLTLPQLDRPERQTINAEISNIDELLVHLQNAVLALG